MGSPLSPIVADLFMESFEQEALNSANDKPKLWVRFVDNTFVIWQHGLDKLEPFQQHLNSVRKSIKFTMETETEGKLPFLDVLVKRDCSHLTTSVFRKKTHTDHYLHYSSHHHPRTKTGVISCLRHRAHNLCKNEATKTELHHLQRTFELNGYPPRLVHNVLHK